MSAAAKLARAIVASAIEAGVAVRVAATCERPWASATFVGARHAIDLAAAATPALDRWLAALPEAEFTVPGHIVADIAAACEGGAIRVSALVLEEA